ncbi:Transport and Golgi organization protein 6-like protein [Bienertia sinuspersici]
MRFELPRRGQLKNYSHGVAGFGRVSLRLNSEQQLSRFGKLSLRSSHDQRLTSTTRGGFAASVVCSAALNATCGAEGQGQTQTVEKPVSVISNAPGKEKSPQLDDGGTGFPPGDDDGGGGGGGGGGGNWSGGFFFFGFLAFLGFLKDQENEGPYQDSRRR